MGVRGAQHGRGRWPPPPLLCSAQAPTAAQVQFATESSRPRTTHAEAVHMGREGSIQPQRLDKTRLNEVLHTFACLTQCCSFQEKSRSQSPLRSRYRFLENPSGAQREVFGACARRLETSQRAQHRPLGTGMAPRGVSAGSGHTIASVLNKNSAARPR